MSTRSERGTWLLSAACAAAWWVLAAAQLGVLPFTRYAWAFNLWRYFPIEGAAIFAAASLALCSSAVRFRVLAATRAIARRAGPVRNPAGGLLGLALVTSLLWLARERHLFGDSGIHLLTAQGPLFLFPDTGASFLLGALFRLGLALGLDNEGCVELIRAAVCVCGALMLLCCACVSKFLAPEWRAPATALLLSGGIVRVFAGHIEVYAFVLVAAAAYLWSAMAALRGRVDMWVPSLVLGVAIWLHLSALCLVPSLLALPLLRAAAPAGWRWRRVATALGLAALPSVVFFLLVAATGRDADLALAWSTFLRIAGLGSDPEAIPRWVRLWGGEPGRGTDYVLLSRAHLKYLVNAAHVLSPTALPLLALAALMQPSLFRATAIARFLSVACAPLLVYALILRPVWGPYDWDLFALTAFLLTALAAHLLAQVALEPRWESLTRELHVWLVGSALLLVTIPFLLMARGPLRDAGPFTGTSFHIRILDPKAPENAPLRPWL